MEFRFGSLTFTSKFDSGNLANVEKVSKDDEETEQTGLSMPSSMISPGVEIKPDFEFNVWTQPDCAGTQYANGNRSWFYFGVRGGPVSKVIKINIMNMNRQGKLYSQGHLPMVRTLPGRPKWERIREKPVFEQAPADMQNSTTGSPNQREDLKFRVPELHSNKEEEQGQVKRVVTDTSPTESSGPSSMTINNNFVLSFTHRFFESRASVTYFAFSYPWSCDTCQERLKELDEKFKSAAELNSKSVKSSIYYHRELLCHSLESRRVDLITISDCHGIQDVEEPRFDKNLFPDLDSKRCKSFVEKKVYVVSSRVHPGETPASFVFNGFLDFILREDDPRAKQLRKQYVFKLIPMLNPDGVSRGHYRTDTRGVNLNRVYLDPTFELYPSIYAAKSLLVYHHIWNSDVSSEEKELIAVTVRSESLAAVSSSDKTTEEGCLGSEVMPTDVNGSSVSNVTRNFVFGCNVSESPAEPGGRLPTSMFDFEGYRITASAGLGACSASFPLVTSSAVEREMMQGNSNLEVPFDWSSSTAAVENSMLGKNTGDVNVVTQSSDSSYLLSSDDPQGSGSVANGLMGFSSCPMDDLAVEKMEKTEVFVRTASECIPKSESLPPCVDLNDFPSRVDCEDFADDFQIGNEGSDDEGCDKTPVISDVVNTLHLSHPKLLSIAPSSSGIAFYVDLHGHAAKRGCFIYGNHFEDEETQIESLLFVKLIALNSAHFDFGGCNFTEKNMYTIDRKDGSTKEGSGRVAAYKALGIIHSYTLECNYNTGRLVNAIPQATGDDGRATPPPVAGFPPKYTQAHYEEVGRAVAVAAIDMTETNPWSRLPSSDYLSVFGLREHMRRYLQSLRTPTKSLSNRTAKAGAKGSSQAVGALPRVALLTRHSSQSQNNENNVNASCNGNSTILKATSRPDAKKFIPVMKKADLGSMKDVPPRLNSSGVQRQRPFSYASGPSSTTVASARCAQPPSSLVSSRRPARCAVMSLVPLSAPLDSSWTSSSEFPPQRQTSSANFQSKAGSASQTSARALHFQSLFAQQSRISKSLNSDAMPDSSLDLSAMHRSVTHALLAGMTPETTAPTAGPGFDRIPSAEASICYSEMGHWRHVMESSSPRLGRQPPTRTRKDDVEPSVLSSLSLAKELTSASLLSLSTKQSAAADGKRRCSIPVLHRSFSKKMESNSKIVNTTLPESGASTGSQLSSLSNTTKPEDNSESCKSKVKGNKPSTSSLDKSVVHVGPHPTSTRSKKTKRKKKNSSDKRTT